ncbi:uncharacterized protein LOC127440573 [Myxocyprinus asiaticus]|uniref:uncharacterized protein LOC127440573 n=1 Tax=Myxocyprinus asiaticus TaxID=70543 RepID=UPI002222AAF3|nr:uncharacterized protein LOC127440573 [Myxocyprinus asiaticus]
MSVGVMEGDSVTLHSDFKEIKRNDYIMWMFGPDSADIRIAEIFKWSYMLSIYVCDKGRFKDALRLDHKNGSLTIKDIRIEYSGLYKLAIINKRKTSYKRFSVKVYAPLPTPVITRDSSQTQNSQASERSSGSKCVLLCSVRNVTQVTLSYYKGSGLISNISGSALNSTLSLPLEVEYDDKNMYSCVVNNAISSQNAHVNITDLCWQSRQFDNTEGNVEKQNKRDFG